MSITGDEAEADCLRLANRLIQICELDFPEITSLQEITSHFFIHLFEKTFDLPVPDLIPDATEIEDEVQNVQAMIDALSLDILKISLVHISGDDIMEKNVMAINNLLEVFEGYLLLCMPELALKPPEAEPSSSSSSGMLLKYGVLTCNVCGYSKIPGTVSLGYKYGDVSSCPICLYRTGFQDRRQFYDEGSPISLASNGNWKKDYLPRSSSLEVEAGQSQEILSPLLDQVPNKMEYPPYTYPENLEDLAVPGTSKQSYFLTESSLKDRLKQSFELASQVSSLSSSPELFSVDGRIPQKRKSWSVDDMRTIDDQRIGSLQKDVTTQTSEISDLAITDKQPKQEETRSTKKQSTTQEDETAVLYGKNLERKIKNYLEDKTHHTYEASQLRKKYLQTLKIPKRKPITPICRKSYLLPYQLRVRPGHSSANRAEGFTSSERGFFRELQEEFPSVSLSPATIRNMNDKYRQHLSSMHGKVKGSLQQKSQTQIQTEEAVKRQRILAEIFRKETEKNEYINEMKEGKALEREVRARERDSRIESARMKHYSDEYDGEVRKRMHRSKNAEEQIVKAAYDERLKLEKAQVNALRKDLREKQQKNAQQHKIYLESLENFYQTQFALLGESLAVEKRDVEERAKAQKKALDKLKRELRSEMENEVRQLQRNMTDGQDTHFRELDAESYRERLRDRFATRDS